MAEAIAAARGALPADGAQAQGRRLSAPHEGFRAALAQVLARVQERIEQSGPKQLPVRAYIAGAAALHLLTGARITEDIDAVFSQRVVLKEDIEVAYRDPDGRSRILYLDRNYNDTLGLLHEDAYRESRAAQIPGIDRRVLDVRVLSPLDLAVSKLGRFADQDREDIELLARRGLIDSRSLRRRAEAALGGYIGDLAAVRASIDIACRLVDAVRPAGRRRKTGSPPLRG